ncbi:complement component C1q receptor [Trichomycterus rosablanca]|uniref:complement component C1q receptor n=1 Tax=Trichomycterus rosablanca TaxID=2290929 RepID=UPI002F36021D
MKRLVGVLMALAFVKGLEGEKPYNGQCAGDLCFTVHTHNTDFNSAQKSCQKRGGYLMSVRTTEAMDIISDLLTGCTGEFWIGLRYSNNFCADSLVDLKGYTWINGDNTTYFTNWKSHKHVCSQKCVSLSKQDSKWTERLCNDAIEGYLCEYKIPGKCKRLTSVSAVLYETPLGFAREDLGAVPYSSNATSQNLGTRFICLDGEWVQAPWSCEVFKGGCEHNCYKLNNTFICTCPSGYKLDSNAVSCSKVHNDPCIHAGCSHICLSEGKHYNCHCHQGFELGEDGKTCQDINDCKNDRLCPDENSHCVNTAGGFECQCKNGFTKEENTCKDIDECVSAPCEYFCNNTSGSYNCECPEGYRLSLENRHKCVLHCPYWKCQAECDFNNPYQCECPPGFILEENLPDSVCIDIDECSMSYCDQHCNNTPGSYICSCDEGFTFIADTTCVKESSTTTHANMFTPTSRSRPTKSASFLSDGGLLGITVCSVIGILLIVCFVHHNIKRCAHKSINEDMHALQQVTTEIYTKKLSIPNIYYKEKDLR